MKKIALNIVSLLLVAAIFYFLGRELVQNWRNIREFSFDFNIPVLLISCAIYILAFAMLAFGWGFILICLRHPVSFYEILLYFCVTQPAKYIPGKIWVAVMRMKFCKNHNIPHLTTLLSTGIETIMEIFACAYISMVAILQTDILGKFSFWGTIAISILGLILLVPRVFYFLINIYLKIAKQPSIRKDLHVSFSKLFFLQITYICAMLSLSLAQFFFLQSFAPVELRHMLFLLGISSFAYIASMLALFAPSGLGVREGIWYIALNTLMAPHISIVYAFVSRIFLIIVEAILVFVALPLLWLKRKRDGQKNPITTMP